MSHPRFFLTEEWDDGLLPLAQDDSHHLVTVLRAECGDEIVVVAPSRRSMLARLTEVTDGGISASLVKEADDVWVPEVHLVQAVAKNPRMDVVIEKATEVGATSIIPLAADRSVVRLSGEKAVERTARWQRVARAASKQSQRTFVPRVEIPAGISDVVASLRNVDHVLICAEGAPGLMGIGQTLDARNATSSDAVAVVVGPEGGLTAAETESLVSHGGVLVTLGQSILRTETAGAVAVALASYELGGLGGTRRD